MVNNKTQNTQNEEIVEAVMEQTIADAKNSAIVVSVVINAFILTAWLVMAVSNQFAFQIVAL